MKNDRAALRTSVVMEFGILIQPYEELARDGTPPTLAAYRRATAKVQAGDPRFRVLVREYGKFGEVQYKSEVDRIAYLLERFWLNLATRLASESRTRDMQEFQKNFCGQLDATKAEFIDGLEHIPLEWESEILEANTPFTSYLKVRDTIAAVRNTLHYFDRYLSESFFPLFLRHLDKNVSIRLVTTAGKANFGVQHVLTLSDLARQEFKDYQLIEVTPADVHDRNLWVDNQNFTLGPGAAQAGMKLTNFGPADSSAAARAAFDAIIAKGRVVHRS